jgi:putative peptidoglycan lipid II flippase
VQVSAFIESMIASFLPTGAIAAIAYAQMLTMLPTSLFGASIAAAELPSMAREDAGPGSRAALAQRLRTGADRIAFFVVPSAVAFFALGDVVAGVVFQTGEFTSADARIVWSIIAAQSIGLVASTQARLVSNAFFAMKDTRTPLRCAIARVVVGLALGALFSLAAPLVLDIPPAYRAAGIGLGSSLGAVVELIALRRALAKVVEGGSGSMALVPRVLAASAASALVAHIAHLGLDPMRLPVWLEGLVVLAVYGGVYLGLTVLLRVGEARAFVDKISRAARRQKS